MGNGIDAEETLSKNWGKDWVMGNGIDTPVGAI
jgi:hypothetical protein